MNWEVTNITPTVTDHRCLLLDLFLSNIAEVTSSKQSRRRPCTTAWRPHDDIHAQSVKSECRCAVGTPLDVIQAVVIDASCDHGHGRRYGFQRDEELKALETEFTNTPNHCQRKGDLAKQISRKRKQLKKLRNARELDAWANGAWGWKKGLNPMKKPVSLRKNSADAPAFAVADWEQILYDYNSDLFNIPGELVPHRQQHLQDIVSQWSSYRDAGAGIGDAEVPIVADDIWWAMHVMKHGKAGGEDGLVLEMLLQLPVETLDAIAYQFTEIVSGRVEIPEDWTSAFVILIEKVRGATLVSDFRPISLCSVLFKLLMRIFSSIFPAEPLIQKKAFLQLACFLYFLFCPGSFVLKHWR